MITAISGLKECLAQISKLESWLLKTTLPSKEKLLEQLQEMSKDIENTIKEAS